MYQSIFIFVMTEMAGLKTFYIFTNLIALTVVEMVLLKVSVTGLLLKTFPQNLQAARM